MPNPLLKASPGLMVVLCEGKRGRGFYIQREALHYVDYLLARQADDSEARKWTRFSAEQLAAQNAEGDAIYDQD